jgi:hypothetical protein
MVQIPPGSVFPDERDAILEGIELPNRDISVTQMRLLVFLNDKPCFVLCGPVRIVFSVVNPLRANWLNMQLPCSPGVESGEGVIEQDQSAFFLLRSFPVISLKDFQIFCVGEWIWCGCC